MSRQKVVLESQAAMEEATRVEINLAERRHEALGPHQPIRRSRSVHAFIICLHS